MIAYAVIDTNVIVSALLSSRGDAATVGVIEKFFAGEIILLYNADILDEYNDVLHRAKFRFPEDEVNDLLSAIERYGIRVDAASSGEILHDIKDLPFYEVALEKQGDNAYLITGNIKHFPQSSFIVTAAQMLEILKK
jgi:putative PIN family toxin of toxin-antitoxin system